MKWHFFLTSQNSWKHAWIEESKSGSTEQIKKQQKKWIFVFASDKFRSCLVCINIFLADEWTKKYCWIASTVIVYFYRENNNNNRTQAITIDIAVMTYDFVLIFTSKLRFLSKLSKYKIKSYIIDLMYV